MQPVANGHQGHLGAVISEEEAAARLLKQMTGAIEDVDAVRDRLTELYRAAAPGTVAECEIGDALQSVRAAMKRPRKAKVELMKQSLPGM